MRNHHEEKSIKHAWSRKNTSLEAANTRRKMLAVICTVALIAFISVTFSTVKTVTTPQTQSTFKGSL